MAEQYVQYNEQNERQPLVTLPTATTPAPMVERALRLLDLLSASEAGLTLSDLARALSMGKSSIHGLLKTLENGGAVEQDEERRYTLGPRIFDIAQTYAQGAGLRHAALPAMRQLAERIGETVLLGRVEPDGVRITERVEAASEHGVLRISAPRGTRVHLLAGATGRLVLASWPPAQRVAYLRERPLPHFTEHTLTDPDVYLAAVEAAAQAGIGEDHEEYLIGVNAVAAPIWGPDGALLALLWVVGFSSRFTDDAMHCAGQELRADAEKITRALGGAHR